MTRILGKARTLGLALASFLLIGADASSSTIIYKTGSTISSVGVDGPAAINFTGVDAGSRFEGTAPFPLGQFAVTPSADGASTSYHDTPFLIKLDGYQAGVFFPAFGVINTIDIIGRLNGSISTTTPSTLMATVDSVQAEHPPLIPGGIVLIFPILPFDPSALSIARDTAISGSGPTPLMASLNGGQPTTTPEPASLAIFGMVVGLVAIRRRFFPAR